MMAQPTRDAAATTYRYRLGGETKDLDMVMGTLAPSIVIHSPLTQRISFEGRTQARTLMRAALATIDEMHYHTDVGDDTTRALVYKGRIGGQHFEEVAIVRLNADLFITEITLWIRPLPGLTKIMGALGPRIAHHHGRRFGALAIAAMSKPVEAMTRAGDRAGARLVRAPSTNGPTLE